MNLGSSWVSTTLWKSWLRKAPADAQVALDAALEGLTQNPEAPGFQWAQVAKSGKRPPKLTWPDHLEPGVPWSLLVRHRGDVQATGRRWWDPVIGMEFVRVDSGEFWMGASRELGPWPQSHIDPGADPSEGPPQKITIDHAFWLSKTPITNRMMGLFEQAQQLPARREHRTRADYPAAVISFRQAVAFCTWLTGALETRAPYLARLPCEAEWEWAARGPTGRHYPWGNKEPSWSLAWFQNGERTPTTSRAVARQPENASYSGALDMAGNIWEWCEDPWTLDYRNPKASHPSMLRPEHLNVPRTLRGGSWGSPQNRIRCAARWMQYPDARSPHAGFRIVLEEKP